MIWCWLWWIYYVETPCLQGHRGISYHFLPLTHGGKNDGASNVISVSTITHRNSQNHTQHWYATTNCFYSLQELFWIVCMVLNVQWNRGLLAFKHGTWARTEMKCHLKFSPWLLSAKKMAPYVQQQTTGSSLCWLVGDLLSHILLKLLQVLVSVVFYLLSPLLIFQ